MELRLQSGYVGMLAGPPSTASSSHVLPATADSFYTSCSALARGMERFGYHVIGMSETFLYESNHTAMGASRHSREVAPYRRWAMRARTSSCSASCTSCASSTA